MINLDMRTAGPLDQTNISSLNKANVRGIVSASNVQTLNIPINNLTQQTPQPQMTPMQPQMTPMQPQMTPMQPQMTPMQPQMTPMQPQMTPMQPQMTPMQPQMTPMQPQMTPMQPQMTPMQPQMTPMQPQMTPMQPQMTPMQPQMAPMQQPVAAPVSKPVPQLLKPVQKGQKAAIQSATPLTSLKACFGWNVNNAQCDVDVSAFLLGADGKVLGDDWFVFYGQTNSPDSSVIFKEDNGADRELVTIDLTRLNPNVKKIVFVLTINEAFDKNLNFSMVRDAYVRIMNGTDSQELVSFKMTDYYSNVISMMIGEVYQHNGAWKFNAVGNGVAKDLAGLCELYGVQVID